MIVTTTSTIEGKTIVEYKETVFGEVISGINVIKDIGASFRDFFGGRSNSYEEELIKARTEALEEMKERALAIGATAIVGMKMDYEVLGSSMLMVTCSGTAVIAR